MRAQLSYREEPWTSFWPESQLLLAAHHEELEPDARAPFVVDSAAASAMDAAGVLSITTARSAAGALVGYCIWYLGAALDSPTICATQGPWFVLPDWRRSGAGLKVFEESLQVLRARGIARAFPHHWMAGGGPALGRYFARLGAKPVEVSYDLWL